MSNIDKYILKQFKSVIVVLLLTGVALGAFFVGQSANAARGGAVGKMRCTQMEVSGLRTYDIITKKMTYVRRKMIINRCVAEDVVCYHSFDQAGLFSCVKR